jgi:phage terminase large subunit
MQEDDKPKPLIFHPAYEPLFAQLPKGVTYVVITGGRGSAKSFSASSGLGVQMHNHGHRILYTRYTMMSAEDSVIPEFKEKLDLLGIGHQYSVQKDRIEGPGKRKVVFKGLRSSSGDQSAKLKSLKDFSCFVLDEAEECLDEDAFNKIDLSIRPNDVQSLIVLILNPSVKTHWIYKRFFEDRGIPEGYDYYVQPDAQPYRIIGDTLYIHTTYLDNIDNLPEDYIAKAEHMRLTNPEAYERIWLGRWAGKSEGVVLTNWRYANEGEYDWEGMVYDGYGLDFGSRDPDALVAVKVLQRQRKILVKQCLYETNLSTRDLARKVLAITRKNLVIGDKSAKRTIQDLKGYGVNIKEGKEFTKGKIISDIKTLKEYEIIVCPESADLGKELNSWTWLDKAAEKTLDGWCHLIDSLRYITRHIIKPVGSGKGIRKISYKRK